MIITSLLTKFDYHVKLMTLKAGDLIKSRYGLWFLGLLSFVESSLLIPLITDPFMVAYILVHRTRTKAAIIVTTLSSIAGGFVAYITAAFFIDLVMNFLSSDSVAYFNSMISDYQNETFVLAFLGAITPVPFTLAALAAGAIKGNLVLFILGAFIGRVIRYTVVGYLAYRFGNQAMVIAKKNIRIISIITVIAICIYVWMKM
jgi:membrane protein YqaA with SNARE-associated domain